MISDEDRALIKDFRESISGEFLRNEIGNTDFWFVTYQGLSLEKRLYMWFLETVRYEHMVGGEFKKESIEKETQLLVKIIKEKDRDSTNLLNALIDRLELAPLQNADISEYMARRIKELI